MPCDSRRSLWLMVVSTLLGLSLSIPGALAQNASSPGNLQFNYAFVALQNNKENPQLIAVESKHLLNSGDKLKFYIEALSEAYFYLFHLGPGGVLSLIFPDDHQTARVTPDQKVIIPGGNKWLELDSSTGMENFYLIASHLQQDRLETLYQEYLTVQAGESKERSTKKIIAEITKIRQKSLSKNAERPVRIGGNFRSPGTNDSDLVLDIADLASKVTTTNTYSRSFTIDHR